MENSQKTLLMAHYGSTSTNYGMVALQIYILNLMEIMYQLGLVTISIGATLEHIQSMAVLYIFQDLNGRI